MNAAGSSACESIPRRGDLPDDRAVAIELGQVGRKVLA